MGRYQGYSVLHRSFYKESKSSFWPCFVLWALCLHYGFVSTAINWDGSVGRGGKRLERFFSQFLYLCVLLFQRRGLETSSLVLSRIMTIWVLIRKDKLYLIGLNNTLLFGHPFTIPRKIERTEFWFRRFNSLTSHIAFFLVPACISSYATGLDFYDNK